MQDPIDDFGRRRSVERHPAGQQFEQDDAQGEQVDAVIDRPSERLLGGHVRDRADDHSRHGHLGLRDVLRGDVRDELRQTEVEDLDQPALGSHQVCALDIAMHDSARVRFVERVGHLDPDFNHLPHRQRTTSDARGKQFAVDVLHHDEIGAVLFANVVGDRDVGRSQHGSGSRFVQKPRTALRIGLERWRQKLQGYGPTQPCIFTAIHFAHPARPEALVYTVGLEE